jgi:tetratricopeptide (TPR) repeat protein
MMRRVLPILALIAATAVAAHAGGGAAAAVAAVVVPPAATEHPRIAACSQCHPDVTAQWAASVHHLSSFNNPYYRVSVDAFRAERGKVASRFCAACHEPLLVETGAIDRDVDAASADAQLGVYCLVCHSIDAVSLDGNGRHHVTSAPWKTGKPEHGARLRGALLADAKLCASCHKVGLEPDVTHDRWLRGQDDYDAWQASAVSGHGAAATFRPPAALRCQDCHMPLEPAVLGDAAAHAGMIRSHRFLGANTAVAHARGDADAEAREASFLAGSVALDARWSDATRVDVVIRNVRVGHRFPGGTNDSNEVWLAVDARDADGRVLARAGALDARGALPADAHLVRAQAVDEHGAPLGLRDPQHMRGTAFDASLGPSEPQVVRFEVPRGAARVEARLLYRKFSADYVARACADLGGDERARCIAAPVVEVARASVAASVRPAQIAGADASDWRTLVAYGLGLSSALAESASEAEPVLARAIALAPSRAEPLLAMARLHVRLGRTDDAVAFAERARALAPDHPAADYWAATALTDAYRYEAARAPTERLLARLPTDRNALSLAARVRGVTGDPRGALEAADRLIAVDPFIDDGHYQRALALHDLGRAPEAALAEAAYLRHRVATETDLELRAKLRAARAGLPDESVPVHTHRLHEETR